MENEAIDRGVILVEIFLDSGIYNAQDKRPADALEVKKQVELSVRKEYKWTYILQAIYDEKVETKITNSEVEEVVNYMIKRPREFNIEENLPKDRVENIALNRMVLNKANQWLYDLVDQRKIS